MKGRGLRILVILLTALLWAFPTTQAQDMLATNLVDLAEQAFSSDHSFYLPWTPWEWRAYSLDSGRPWWVDCSQLPCADLLQASTNLNANLQAFAVVFTKNVSTGVTTVQPDGSTNVVAVMAAPSDYQPGEQLGQNVWLWREWQQMTNCPDCWGVTADEIPPPTVTLKTRLADASQYSTYASNVEAEAEASAAAQASSASSFAAGGGMMFMGMDDESDPCTITNESAPFSVVSITTSTQGCDLVWSSCTDHIYVVQSESSLTPTSSWTDVAWMFGANQSTSWTDSNAVGLAQEFYRVVRGNPNTLNYGIPYDWAVENGFDPLNPNLALEDPTGDGFTLLEDYVNGTNPNVTNTTPVFIINNGKSYTTTLSIPVQATRTNYPKIRVWLDTLSTNVTLFTNTGAPVTYTLPDEGDGVYGVYAQYANTNGTPASQVFGQSVTLDRTAPVVAITAPASNAVLNQAFMTLAATVYDPIGTQPNIAAPLSIWINGQPYWERAGTNLVVERYPVPVPTNAFTVTIRAVNSAGLTNSASRTWTVNTATATNAPHLLSANLSSEMLLPNVNSIWVEGTVDNDYALVRAIVTAASGGVITNALIVGQNQYKGLVPLGSGTNQLLLLASDAAGNTSSNMYTIISSTEFSAAITNPVFGAFAAAPSSYVSGYVSALYDAGLPTQSSITNVTINGVAAVLGTNIDAYGNISFATTNKIPLGVPITGTIAGPGIPTGPPSLPPMMSQGYEIVAKETVLDDIAATEGNAPFNLSWNTANNCWQGDLYRTVLTYDYTVTNGSAHAQGSNLSEQPSPLCQTLLNPDQINWQGSSIPFTLTLRGPIDGSLSFGVDWYLHGPGEQFAVVSASYDPTNNTCTFQNETDALRTVLWQKNAGWVTFQVPPQSPTNATVVLTFQGMTYALPNNGTLDLSQVQFRGQSPVSNDSQSVSYLMTTSPRQQYTINPDDFIWPSFSPPTNYSLTHNDTWDTCPLLQSYSWAGNYLTDLHRLSWTGFTNHSPVHIVWTNGMDITGTSGNSIIVGQQVNLTASVDTPGIATSNFTWSVSGSAISNYVVASDSSSAQMLPLTQTNSASVDFYWVSGGQQNVTCSVVLNNGSIATSQASFNVQRPTAQVAYVKGTVGADSNFYLGNYLHYGTSDNSGTSCEPGLDGIVCTYAVNTLPGFSGIYGWFHLNSSAIQYKQSDGTSKQCLPSGYDGALPFGSACFYDTPGFSLAGHVEVTEAESHQTWLMFQPSVTNSIWVPLKQVNWGWSGDAVLTNGTWTLPSHSNPDPTVTDATMHPSWTSTWSTQLENCYLNGF
jgi:hypothetical protein